MPWTLCAALMAAVALVGCRQAQAPPAFAVEEATMADIHRAMLGKQLT